MKNTMNTEAQKRQPQDHDAEMEAQFVAQGAKWSPSVPDPEREGYLMSTLVLDGQVVGTCHYDAAQPWVRHAEWRQA
jgi:hypothetical protein